MERKQMLKGVFMIYQKSGYIGGTGKSEVPVTNGNGQQKPLLPPSVEQAIRERKEEDKKDPPDPKKKQQAPLLPPFIKTDKK